MSDMVERVAEAISEARTGNSLSWRHYVAEAQAAIAAMQADAAPVATSDWQDAIEAAQDVLAGRGNGTYDEALDAIRWLLQFTGIHDAPIVARVSTPKPVDEAWDEAWGELNDKAAKLETFRAALAKRGLEVREIEG